MWQLVVVDGRLLCWLSFLTVRLPSADLQCSNAATGERLEAAFGSMRRTTADEQELCL